MTLFISQLINIIPCQIFARRAYVNNKAWRSLPAVHPAVNDWIIHGVAHGQPVDSQIERLKPGVLQYVRMLIGDEEADVLR